MPLTQIIESKEMLYSTRSQHFLREDKELNLKEKELKSLERRGILTLEELAEPDEEFILKRKPISFPKDRFLELMQKSKQILHSIQS